MKHLFLVLSFQNLVSLSSYSTSQFILATSQMLNSYMWLVAILLVSTVLEASKVTTHFNLGDREKSNWFSLFYKRGNTET